MIRRMQFNFFCSLCSVKITDPSAVESHFKGKKHSSHLAVEKAKICVIEPPMNLNLEAINVYFKEKGSIKHMESRLDPRILIYVYENYESVNQILAVANVVNGVFLNVKKFRMAKTNIIYEENRIQLYANVTNKQNNAQTATIPNTVAPNINVPPSQPGKTALTSKNNKNVTEETQVKAKENEKQKNNLAYKLLLFEMKKGATFNEQLNLLLNELNKIRNNYITKCNKVCDDVKKALRTLMPNLQVISFGSHSTGLIVTKSDLDLHVPFQLKSSETEMNVLQRIRKMLLKSRMFTDIITINARVPIARFTHQETGIQCDLNIKSMIAYWNSNLISYYLSLHENFKSTLLILKLWNEIHHFPLTSYALCMMFIFYLQVTMKLPSVYELQKNVDKNCIDHWNVAFERRQRMLIKIENFSVEDILFGFLKFYAEFDYDLQVICPFYGQSLPKISFISNQLPEVFTLYRAQSNLFDYNTPICVQDVFEHHRNITMPILVEKLWNFVEYCQLSSQNMNNRQTLYQFITKTKPTTTKILPFQNCLWYLNEKASLQKDNRPLKEIWFEEVIKFMHYFLTEVLLVEFEEELKCLKNERVFKCGMIKNVWTRRKAVSRELFRTIPNEIEKHSVISKELFRRNGDFAGPPVYLELRLRLDAVGCTVKSPDSFRKKGCPYFSFIQMLSGFMINYQKKLKITQHVELPNVMEETDTAKPTEPIVANPDVHVKIETKIEVIDEVGDEDPPNTSPVCEALPDTLTVHEEPSSISTVHEKSLVEAAELAEGGATENRDEEEDVPADFFDDFSDQDFMAGLDIVDAWEDKPKDDDVQTISDGECYVEPIVIEDSNRRKRQRSTSIERHRSRRHSRDRSYGRSRERESTRRDPEKTRRDIHRDKMRCARDKEQKILKDRLKIVETGLVPPGMETEVDLTTVAELCKPKRLYDEEVDKRRRRSISRERRRSPFESPHRPRSRGTYRRLSRSPIPDTYDRLRYRRQRSRSRSRESPHRTKMRRIEMKKKSFLEEIRDKLNETHPRSSAGLPKAAGPPVQTVPYMSTAPAPVPPPMQYYQPPAPASIEYDSEFFIGAQPASSYDDVGVPVTQMPLPAHKSVASNRTNNVSVKLNDLNTISNVQMPIESIADSSKSADGLDNLENLSNLFADKKISLSDFLSMAAKSQGVLFVSD